MADALVAQLAQQRGTASSVSCGVSEAVGSSSSSTRERSDSALAISTSCILATLSCDTGVRGSTSSSSMSSQRRASRVARSA